jgi:cobalt/nickel transport system ATP-binding protein
MIFQDPDDQLFMPTVFEDVAFGPCNLGLSDTDVEQRVSAALAQVGAGHLRGKPPYNLSGGEKKRVAIATVLSMAPDILVMDEPTSGLDSFARRQMITLINDFHHTRIITSHDLDMVYEVCERTIILNRGKVAADGPTRNVFENADLLKECRLERPLSLQGCPHCSNKIIE